MDHQISAHGVSAGLYIMPTTSGACNASVFPPLILIAAIIERDDLFEVGTYLKR
jgi:hypothetical protein